jgi:hypothetical protein
MMYIKPSPGTKAFPHLATDILMITQVFFHDFLHRCGDDLPLAKLLWIKVKVCLYIVVVVARHADGVILSIVYRLSADLKR